MYYWKLNLIPDPKSRNFYILNQKYGVKKVLWILSLQTTNYDKCSTRYLIDEENDFIDVFKPDVRGQGCGSKVFNNGQLRTKIQKFPGSGWIQKGRPQKKGSSINGCAIDRGEEAWRGKNFFEQTTSWRPLSSRCDQCRFIKPLFKQIPGTNKFYMNSKIRLRCFPI